VCCLNFSDISLHLFRHESRKFVFMRHSQAASNIVKFLIVKLATSIGVVLLTGCQCSMSMLCVSSEKAASLTYLCAISSCMMGATSQGQQRHLWEQWLLLGTRPKDVNVGDWVQLTQLEC
jgi:histidine ammonia-lyase